MLSLIAPCRTPASYILSGAPLMSYHESFGMSYLSMAQHAHGCRVCRSCSSTSSLQLQHRPPEGPTLARPGCECACPTTAHHSANASCMEGQCGFFTQALHLTVDFQGYMRAHRPLQLGWILLEKDVSRGYAHPVTCSLTESPSARASGRCSLPDLCIRLCRLEILLNYNIMEILLLEGLRGHHEPSFRPGMIADKADGI